MSRNYIALLLGLAGCFNNGAVEGEFKITEGTEDWRDEIVYQLMVDRFANGDINNDGNRIDPNSLARYQGGDWQGVIDNVHYLKELGVTAIWISPIIRNVDTDAGVDGYHGYWAQDMTTLNPHFGDLGKLREMVNVLHANGFKVILDIVTNHVGQLFYYDINGNGQPDESIWGSGSRDSNGRPQDKVQHFTEFDPDFDPNGIQAFTSLGYSGLADIRWLFMPEIHRMPPMPPEFQNPDWWNRKGRVVHYDPAEGCDDACARQQTLEGDFPGGLKDVKTELTEVREAMTKVFARWMDLADFDGFRIDTLKHVEHGFWQHFCPAIREHAREIGKKNFFMFGEAFDGRDSMVGEYTKDDEVDSAFFFPQKFSIYDRVIKAGGASGTKHIETQFETRKALYATKPHNGGIVGADGEPLTAQDLMVNFMDNHDVGRFLYEKNSIPALHNALAFLLTEDGIPCIYYGTEQQFDGGNDPANRERLWDSGAFDLKVPRNETFKWTQKLIQIRKKFSPLRRGKLQIVWTSERTGSASDAGIAAFERLYGDKRVLVVFNFSEQQSSATRSPDGAKMKVGFAPGTGLVDVLTGDPAQVGGDGTLDVTLEKRSQRIYVPADQQDGM